MRERLLSAQEVRIILGAEEPRWKWSWRRAVENFAGLAVLTWFGWVMYTMFLMMAGGK